MSNSVKKMPVKTEENAPHPAKTDLRHPFEKLRQQVDRLFDDFNRGTGISPFSRGLFDVEPFWRREFSTSSLPAVDISEKEKSFEITAELPGMDQKDIEIRLANGNLIIKGEKKKPGKKRKRVITSPSAITVPSSACSTCQKASTATRSKPSSAKAC